MSHPTPRPSTHSPARSARLPGRAGLLALCLACSAAQAMPDWRPLPASTLHKSLPAHLADLAALPPGAVTPMHVHAGDKRSDDALWITLPDGARYRLDDPQRSTHPNGDITLAATLAGVGSAGTVLMTIGAEASFGSWRTPQGEYRFESRGAQGWLVDLGHPQLSIEDADSHALPAPAGVKQAAVAADKSTPTIIDVLFLYSADFAARYPGSAAMTRLNHINAVANQSFANSDLPLVLRIVGADLTHYPDSEGDNGAALHQMRNALRGQGAHPAFSGLGQRRSQTGADLVTLIWPHDLDIRGSCGIAFLFGNDRESGVNVVADGFSSWSLCGDEVFAHEVGHNLGAEHQHGANSPNAGFGTAHIVPGQFNTIMGSFGSGHPDRHRRVLRFSNPQQLCGGRPCGVAGVSDNTRRLRDNMAAVAAYSPTVVPVVGVTAPAPLDPDVDGDGVPESRDAFPFDPRYHSDRDGDGVPDELDAFPDDPSEWADTDGDGIGDNADPDIDGDGVPNALDAFPYDPTEWADSDGDGVGDNADAFPFDRTEWRDTDGDGIGDNADPDADGDGVPDVATGGTPADLDLLVIAAGSERVLRYDADTGLFAGVEFSEAHVPLAFGPQSTLAWNPHQKQLYSLNSSELRRYDRASRQRLDTFVAGWRGGERPGFPSGFPVALAITDSGRVFATDHSTRTLLRHDAISGELQAGGVFGVAGFFAQPPRALVRIDARLWAIERGGQLSEVDITSGALLRRLTPSVLSHPGIEQPTAMVASADGRSLFVADAASHRVLRIDTSAPSIAHVFVAAGSGGLQAPAGLALGGDGHLYVASSGNDRVLRFDGSSGAFIDRFDRSPPGVLQQPRALLFVPKVSDRFPLDGERRFLPVPGGWENPARSGHGLDLQRVGDQVAVIWYTYRADGTPTWYLASGRLHGADWQAPLLQFRWHGTHATFTEVGEATLHFHSERRADFGWRLGAQSGTEPMQPLAVGTSSETQFPTAAWYAPAQNGWGLSVTRQGETDYAMAFVYDDAGEPSWFAGAVSDPAQPQRYLMQRFIGPTRCPGCAGTAAPDASPAGHVHFVADGLDQATIEAALDGGGVRWHRSTLTFERLTDTPTRPDGTPLP